MIRVSLPRFGSSKGISTVVGTVFLVLTVLGVSSSIFLWTMTQNALYNQAVKESRQMDADRFSERVIAFRGNYSVSGGNVQVIGILANEGPVSAQVLTLWVLDENNKEYNVTDLRERNYNLNPGDTLSINIEVTIPGASPDHTYNSWFVTARGNRIPLEKEKVIIVAELAQGIGSLAMEFYTFRYFTYENSTTDVLANYPDGNVSFNVPQDTDVAFGCVLTNLDPERGTIVLDSHSLLWIIMPQSDVPHSRWWYIVNVAGDGTISPDYSDPIELPVGESKLLVFAAQKDLGSSGFTRQKTPKGSGGEGLSVPVFLLLHGTSGWGEPYGQNLPFVALYIEP